MSGEESADAGLNNWVGIVVATVVVSVWVSPLNTLCKNSAGAAVKPVTGDALGSATVVSIEVSVRVFFFGCLVLNLGAARCWLVCSTGNVDNCCAVAVAVFNRASANFRSFAASHSGHNKSSAHNLIPGLACLQLKHVFGILILLKTQRKCLNQYFWLGCALVQGSTSIDTINSAPTQPIRLRAGIRINNVSKAINST